ncbi:alpha/beta hydrolase [Flavobacteriales bacterium]|jgi:pimeloyl-ACP methyl ester carboxylesterase|nr:alpha/beta hydrolase [Flavobacteriales bacterium]MDB4052239.1 alpha/beta hydrolase [Flavobacteriales bacterium]MDC1370797.1 alpha/beta hydrolase [Flavobacteriales bacterium]
MKYIILMNRLLLNLSSYIAPKFCSKLVVSIFSKVRIKNIRDKEQSFYTQAREFKVSRKNEDIHCYELGNPDGQLLFLVHGWESNPGCFTQFLPHLQDFRIIAFTLPGHAKNKETHTNLYKCKDAFKLVLDFINPTEPFHVVAHSLGSSVSAFALSETDYKADKLVFLSANNHIVQVFKDFQKLVGFNNRVFRLLENRIEKMVGDKLSEMKVEERLEKVKFNELLLIHDKYDKIIRFKNSEELHAKFSNSKLIPFEKIGHYRMLWNEKVLEEVLRF